MKKRSNTIFFGLCFLAALLAEAYCLVLIKGNLYTMSGIGILVLVTGYQLMDSIRRGFAASRESVKFYMDQMYREELDRSNERFLELINLLKGTYTVMKKGNTVQSEQLGGLLKALESLENKYIKDMQKVTELQKRSLEGQKKAVNIEVQYSRENAKQIIRSLKEEGKKIDFEEQLTNIIKLLEMNNELLQKQKDTPAPYPIPSEEVEPEVIKITDYMPEKSAVYNADASLDSITNEQLNKKVDQSEDYKDDEPAVNVIPLYEDPHKNLTVDEIAALFASVGR